MKDTLHVPVLAVDDKPENLLVLDEILSDLDVEMVRASSGNEALASMLERDYALVILDVQMPGMNGFEVAELMRGTEKTKGIPIIFITAVSKNPRFVFKGYESGAVDYLCKPIEPSLLISKVGVFGDLWRQKKVAEKATKEAQKALTELQHSERALRIAKENTEKAYEYKSQFLANTTHELRTPLNGIMGFLDILAQTDPTEEQKECMEYIRQSSDIMIRLIEDILDCSKIEAGKVTLDVVDFELTDVIDCAISTVAFCACKKDIQLDWGVDQNVPSRLRGDQGRLKQVIQHLVGNAVKFTEAGCVELRVSMDEEIGSQVGVRFVVTDTGIGIPPAKQSCLFDSFFQADMSVTRKFTGAGLGLTVCKHLVELMGGAIGVDSEEGKGSTFWFTVVLAKPSPTEHCPNDPKDSVLANSL